MSCRSSIITDVLFLLVFGLVAVPGLGGLLLSSVTVLSLSLLDDEGGILGRCGVQYSVIEASCYQYGPFVKRSDKIFRILLRLLIFVVF